MRLVSTLAFRRRNPSYLRNRRFRILHILFWLHREGISWTLGMFGMRAPCQFLLILDQAIVKIQSLFLRRALSCSPKPCRSIWWIGCTWQMELVLKRQIFYFHCFICFISEQDVSNPFVPSCAFSCFIKSLVNSVCLCLCFRILLRLSLMSTSHGVEEMEGISHLGSLSKHSFQGPDQARST